MRFVGTRAACVMVLGWVASAVTAFGAASAAVSVTAIVKFNGTAIPTSGGSYPATGGSATFSLGVSGTFATTKGVGGDPPNDSFDVIVDGTDVDPYLASKSPISGGISYTNSSLVLGVGSHTIYALISDANGTSATSAIYTFTVYATPQLSVSTSTLNLGSAAVGHTSAPVSLTVSNATGAGTSAAVTGTPSAPFAAGSASCSSGSSLNAIQGGGSCTIPYTFAPTTAGSASQTFALSSSGSTVGSVTIQGVGEAAPTASISSPANGSTVAYNTSVNVNGSGGQPNGAIASLALLDNGVQLTSVSGGGLSYAHVFPTGTHSLTLVATDNLGTQTTSSAVSLTVQPAAAPVLSMSSGALNLGSKALNQTSAAASVTVSNTGNATSAAITGAPSAPFAVRIHAPRQAGGAIGKKYRWTAAAELAIV